MGIHDEDIARVRASADLVAIIGEHTEIKRSGRNFNVHRAALVKSIVQNP